MSQKRATVFTCLEISFWLAAQVDLLRVVLDPITSIKKYCEHPQLKLTFCVSGGIY